MIELCCIHLIDGVPCYNAFAFYLDSTNLGTGALLSLQTTFVRLVHKRQPS